MNRRYRSWAIAPAIAVVALGSACDAVDRARSAVQQTDPPAESGAGLALSLQAPGVLRAGEEGTFRLSVTNHTDSVAGRAMLDLTVPGWVEPAPPRPGDHEVSLTALEQGGTRFTYRLDGTPIDPAQTLYVEQRIRVRSGGPQAAEPWGRTIQARLLGAGGETLAEVSSEVSLDTVPFDSSGGAAVPPGDAAIRDRLGPIRLGMVAGEVRTAVPAARDTVWSQEGMQQDGILVPVRGDARALAVLDRDTVIRIEVGTAMITTAEGLGVGSRFSELRGAYGRACADAAEGRVVVWFQGAPGISFAVGTPVPEDLSRLRSNPDAALPADAEVTRWWLHGGAIACPR